MSNVRRTMGIIGGGQLAQMLFEASTGFNAEILVFSEALECPARVAGAAIFQGSIQDEKALRSFFSKVGIVLFENEFVDCDLIEAAAAGFNVRFVPSVGAIRETQDKLRQKKLLAQLGIPTSQYSAFDPAQQSLEEWIENSLKMFSGAAVFKWDRLGYDGKGVFITKGASGESSQLKDFCVQAGRKGVGVFAEKKIDFTKELAMVAVYSPTGEFTAYPLVQTRQSSGICDTVIGPATALGIDAGFEKNAASWMRKLAEALSLHGAFAMEFFVDSQGSLLVNEIAPRVHNSGHYTQDASQTSQFENHLRAALGERLGSVKCSPGYAMLNLLGPQGVKIESLDRHVPKTAGKVRPHWYGKKDILPGRKLGHLNGAVDSADQLNELLKELERARNLWVRSVAEKTDS
jgi:5-(carboxyamino)imidazole ribonucleotide synthase